MGTRPIRTKTFSHPAGLRDVGRNPEQRIQKSPIMGLLDLNPPATVDSLQLSGENREFPLSPPAPDVLENTQEAKNLVAGAGFEPTTFGL